MSCTNLISEDGPLCGDEGRLCDECAEREAAEWEWMRNVSRHSVLPPDKEYEQELRDAGRGHLLPP